MAQTPIWRRISLPLFAALILFATYRQRHALYTKFFSDTPGYLYVESSNSTNPEDVIILDTTDEVKIPHMPDNVKIRNVSGKVEIRNIPNNVGIRNISDKVGIRNMTDKVKISKARNLSSPSEPTVTM